MSIGDYSSIASLILFLLYFAGRVWAAKRSISSISDKFYIVERKDNEPFPCEKDIIILDTPGETIFSITSQYPLIKLQVRPYRFENVIGGESKENVSREMLKPIHTKYMIPAETPVFFQSDLAECIPHYLIWFQRSDYVEGSFAIAYNCKDRNGSLLAAEYQLRSTLKSVLYYFCK